MDATATVASLESILREYELFAKAEPALLEKYRFALESIDAIKKNGVCRSTMESIETQLTDLDWQPALFPSQASQMSVNYALEAIDKTRAGILITVLTGVLGLLYKLVRWVIAKFRGYDTQISNLQSAKRALTLKVTSLEKQLGSVTQTMSEEKQKRVNDVFYKSPQFQQARRGGDFFLALLTGNPGDYNLDSAAVRTAFPRVIEELTYEYGLLVQGYNDRALSGNLRILPLRDSAAFWSLVLAMPRGIDSAGNPVAFSQAQYAKDPNDVLRQLRDGVNGLLNTPTHLDNATFLGSLRKATVLTTDVTALFPAGQDVAQMRTKFDALQSKFITLNNQIRADVNSGVLGDGAFQILNTQLSVINVKFQALSNILFVFSQLIEGVDKLIERDAKCLAEYGRQVGINA